jgi:hypothetical protein
MTSSSKISMKQRLQDHLAEYGGIALVIFLAIFALTYLGFFVAIKSGIDVGDSAAGSTGTLLAAWFATKLTLPIRIGATFALTPLAASLLHKLKRSPVEVASSATDDKH